MSYKIQQAGAESHANDGEEVKFETGSKI